MSVHEDEFPAAPQADFKPERYRALPHKLGACVADRARDGEIFCVIDVRDLERGDAETALARAQDIAAAFNRFDRAAKDVREGRNSRIEIDQPLAGTTRSLWLKGWGYLVGNRFQIEEINTQGPGPAPIEIPSDSAWQPKEDDTRQDRGASHFWEIQTSAGERRGAAGTELRRDEDWIEIVGRGTRHAFFRPAAVMQTR